MKILSDFVRTAQHAEHKQADHFAKSRKATRSDDPVVAQAVQTFRREFSKDVDQDDLENITQLWESLTPDQAQAVFSELTPEEVEGWGNEARRSTGCSDNGLTGGQQQDLFNTLASRLNGEQLAQVAVAFNNSDRMQEAVATYAPADTKAEFLVATVPDADDPADRSRSVPITISGRCTCGLAPDVGDLQPFVHQSLYRPNSPKFVHRTQTLPLRPIALAQRKLAVVAVGGVADNRKARPLPGVISSKRRPRNGSILSEDFD